MGKLDDLDGNTAALRIKEREDDRLDREQAAIEARAEPVFLNIMQNLDSDVIDGAFGQLTKDEYASLVEDLGHGPPHDLAHIGSILRDALERYAMQLAIKEVS
jgi:hypothetical protein